MRKGKNINALPKIRIEMRNEKDLNKEGKTALRYIIRQSGEKKIVRSTGLYIEPQLWDKKKMRAYPKTPELIALNDKLSKKIADFNGYFTRLYVNRERVTREDIEDYFLDRRFDDLFAYFDAFIEECKPYLAKATANKYVYCRNALHEYTESRKILNLKFIDVDRALIEGFHKYLLYERKGGMASNSANNYHKALRKMFDDAISRRVIDRHPYKGARLEKKGDKIEKAILSSDEVNAIRELEFSDKEWNMRKSRDLFLFILNTGLRICDVRTALISELKRDNKTGNLYLERVQKKTKVALRTFLTEEARMMIHRIRSEYYAPLNEKYKDRLFGRVVDQNVNRHLKVIAERAGIEKTLSNHVGRHTLATQLHNNGNVSMKKIAGVLGHKSTKMTNVYVRNDNESMLPVIENLYSKGKCLAN